MPSSPEADEESACFLSPLRLWLSDPELLAVTSLNALFSVQELLGVAVDLAVVVGLSYSRGCVSAVVDVIFVPVHCVGRSTGSTGSLLIQGM